MTKCSTRPIVWSAGHLNGQKFMFVPNFAYFGFWFWNKLMTKIEFFFKIPTYVFECITFVHHALKIQICHKTLWGCKIGCFVLKNKIFLFENLEKKCFGRRNTEIALYVLWEEDCKIFIGKEEKSRACFLNFFSKFCCKQTSLNVLLSKWRNWSYCTLLISGRALSNTALCSTEETVFFGIS